MTHILLIETSNKDIRLITQMYHEAETSDTKYKISILSTAADAVRMLAGDNDIDLVLAEIIMADGDDQSTLETLKDTARELPVIYMTNSNDETLILDTINAGAMDYLVKGHIDSDVLARVTRYAIERKKAQSQITDALRQASDDHHQSETLRRQKKELIALNKAKDEFISLSSHQLRTPATGVKQYLGMVLEGYAGEVPEGLLVFLRTAFESNERQLDIINDLLKTAQLDSGRFILRKALTDICKLIHEVVKEYTPIIAMRRQQITVNGPSSCYVRVDPIEMKLAISNLIENASKYSIEETTIQIGITREADTVKISIRDEGVGIDSQSMNKIFDKFTRINNELSDTVSGSGLGLYFVKRIIKIHNGRLQVRSKLNKGSTFTIILPL